MNATALITEDKVRLRSIEIWEERGRPEGYDVEFWLQAERELMGEDAGGRESANASSAKSGGGSDVPA
ncbi:DUF2934 domain-containing protein [Methylobacterium sp. CM6244]